MMCNGNTIYELGEPDNLRIPLHYSVVALIFKSIAHVPKPFQVTQWKEQNKKNERIPKNPF